MNKEFISWLEQQRYNAMYRHVGGWLFYFKNDGCWSWKNVNGIK